MQIYQTVSYLTMFRSYSQPISFLKDIDPPFDVNETRSALFQVFNY